VFCLLTAIFTLNAARYVPAVLSQTGLSTFFVVMTIYTIQWMPYLLLYVLNSLGLCRRLHALMTALRGYEREFQYCAKPPNFNAFLRKQIVTGWVVAPLFCSAYTMFTLTCLPEAKWQLTPFTYVEGPYFFLAASVLAVVFTGYFLVTFGSSLSMYYSSLLLEKEFVCLARAAELLFQEAAARARGKSNSHKTASLPSAA
jgi:hypothetical protein